MDFNLANQTEICFLEMLSFFTLKNNGLEILDNGFYLIII